MSRPSPRTISFLLATAVAAGCSLQDFDYLQHGAGGVANAGGGGGNAAAGKSTQGGNDVEGEGGDMTTPGVAGKQGDTGGNGGVVGNGGKASVAGSPSGGTGGGAGGPTGQLINPSFETGNTTGWVVEPPQIGTERHAFVQGPQGTSVLPDGNYQLSTWHKTDAFVVDVYQTIEGVKDGTYTFKGYVARGDGFNAVQIYAKDCGGASIEPLALPLPGPSDWLAVKLGPIEVKGGKCTVGVHIDSNATNWFNADLFSFEPDDAGGQGGDGGGGGT